jgi:hypothetical protein
LRRLYENGRTVVLATCASAHEVTDMLKRQGATTPSTLSSTKETWSGDFSRHELSEAGDSYARDV